MWLLPLIIKRQNRIQIAVTNTIQKAMFQGSPYALSTSSTSHLRTLEGAEA